MGASLGRIPTENQNQEQGLVLKLSSDLGTKDWALSELILTCKRIPKVSVGVAKDGPYLRIPNGTTIRGYDQIKMYIAKKYLAN